MNAREPVILIVEDDVNDQFLLKTAFKEIHCGGQIHAVDSGEDAIRYLKGKEQYANRNIFPVPTILTIDLKMPKMNGFELLSFLKQNPHLTVIPTVILTSSTDENDVTNAFLLGANAYHVKPHSFEGLCKLLRILHDYWSMCEIPKIGPSGELTPTHGDGKLSENVPRPARRDKE